MTRPNAAFLSAVIASAVLVSTPVLPTAGLAQTAVRHGSVGRGGVAKHRVVWDHRANPSAHASAGSGVVPGGYGRGYEGYDGRPGIGSDYGVATASALPGDGLDDPADPGYGYGIGLPAYIYPLSTFWPHEMYERGSLDMAAAGADPGGSCTTPVRSCVLHEASFTGLGCSCRSGDRRVRGLVTR